MKKTTTRTLPLSGWLWHPLLSIVIVSMVLAEAAIIGFTLLTDRWQDSKFIWLNGGLILLSGIVLPGLYWRTRVMVREFTDALESFDSVLRGALNGEALRPLPFSSLAELQQTAVRLQTIAQQRIIKEIASSAVRRKTESARSEAQAIFNLKTEFLALVSHEIRTPMNGILGMIELLLDSRLTPQQQEFAKTVQDSAQSLLNIIDNILDLSKIEAGNIHLKQVCFSPVELVEGIAETLAPLAHGKALKLMSYIDPEMPAVLSGDEGRLRQILLHLVSNAVRFTEQGEISIRASFERKASRYVLLRFSVMDTGIGIPRMAHARLFQPFSQVDASSVRRYGGAGLGLSICKRLVEVMGGEIGLESQKGEGAHFWFRVPVRFTEMQTMPRQMPPVRSGFKALIVEQGKDSRTVLQDYLRSWRIQVIAVADMLKASALIQTLGEVDVLFIGLSLERGEIDQVSAILATDSYLHKIPRVLVADTDRENLEAEIRLHGFHACLVKPVRQAQLFGCLETITNSALRNLPAVTGIGPTSSHMTR